jgi:hypothetical protein
MRAFPSIARVPAKVSEPVLAPAGALAAESCWPGIARQQVTFFCFAKRKSPKKRRPAVWVPCASLRGNLRCSTTAGSRANSPSAQTSAIPDPPTSALLGPARTGQSGAGTEDRNTNKTITNKDTPRRVLVDFGIRLLGIPFPHPLWMRRGAQGQTDQGSRCLSEAQRSEFSETPSGPSTAGCPQRSVGTQQPGSPFLLLTFLLAKQKKSELPPGNPRPTALSKEHTAEAKTGKVGGGTTP